MVAAKRLDLPKHQIDSIVAKYHVGTPDETIKADIRNRAVANKWAAADIRRAERYAVASHRKNQKLYAYVMGGGR